MEFLSPCHPECLCFDLFLYIRILGKMSFEEKGKKKKRLPFLKKKKTRLKTTVLDDF